MKTKLIISAILLCIVFSPLAAQTTNYRFTNQDVGIYVDSEIRTMFSMRNTGKYGGSHSWTFLVANSNGFYGVPSNGFDIWEYPNNASSSYKGDLRRLSIMTGRDRTTVPSPVIIGGNGCMYIGFAAAPATNYNDLSVNGNVGIGTSNTQGYKLAVKGTIRAYEVRVDTGWADFVFEDDYELPSLDEVASHIKENKHLPGIPSAKEVEENGIGLAEMNMKLLQKIEELTLYTINQQSLIDQQQEMIEIMNKRMHELENKVN